MAIALGVAPRSGRAEAAAGPSPAPAAASRTEPVAPAPPTQAFPAPATAAPGADEAASSPPSPADASGEAPATAAEGQVPVTPAQPGQAAPAPATGYPPPYPYPYPYPYAYPPPAPVEPPEKPPKHRHEGLYLGLGVGAFYGWIDFESAVGRQAKITGFGLAMEALLGGTPVEGLVVGGGLLLYAFDNPKVKQDGLLLEEPYEASIVSLALFTTYYPEPSLGWHLQGMVGAGMGKVAPTTASATDAGESTGILLGLGAGWEGWISSRWSLGARLRFSYAPLESHQVEGNDAYRTILPGIFFIGTMQ